MTSRWAPAQLARLRADTVGNTPVITSAQTAKMVEGLDLWDLGPVRTPAGAQAQVDGTWLWIGLSCLAEGDPAQRHERAVLRLLARGPDLRWLDLGPVFPAGAAHGNRQWAGSAVLDGDRIWVTYTAVGSSDPRVAHFRQRLFGAEAEVDRSSGEPRLVRWSLHSELFPPDPTRYDRADENDGRPGFIKAFRDPFPFRDPATTVQHVLFTASLPSEQSRTDFNGAIGVARRTGAGWEVLDPLVTADGVNNELERPHVLVHDSHYYLFFSTQSRTFHPDVPAPTGLYGFVSNELLGDYVPINGHGAVFTNPPEQPLQAYSWMVLDDLTVHSFIDAHSLVGPWTDHLDVESITSRREHFGGTLAPPVRIELDGDRAWIAS
ncbi:glycoside hydrolase family 68 protein [Actinospongicola halichondriae]|uniref:glycoside hydrolase family 68 protein n=1 Tax=Actinospongicola halichondriae TaxID=3236844 RepID=UPI003D4D35B0